MKKTQIELKSINTKMDVVSKYNFMFLAKFRYNNINFHATYYFELPTYSGDEKIQIIDKLQIEEWYYLDNFREVHDELTEIFEKLLAANK